MKIKDLFSNKNLKNIVIFAFVIFLALPIIFPETSPVKILKKENILNHEDSPLPIFSKDNLLKKYVKRLKNFYNLEKSNFLTPAETVQEVQDEEINAYDLFFSAENEDEPTFFAQNSEQWRDDSINLQKGTALTADGLLIEPTQEGYYYQGKFYKNGTYPENADKRAIEGALSRYHNAIARSQGKKALYYADNDGNLTVDYVNEYPNKLSNDIDSYFAKNPAANGVENAQDIMLANAGSADNYDKYRGATINGLNSKNDFGNSGANMSDISAASFRDMHAAYNMLSNRVKSGELLKDADIPKPDAPNSTAVGYINIQEAVNHMPVMEDLWEQIKEMSCHGQECANAIRVAPDLKGKGSDLEQYYESFCKKSEDGNNDDCITRTAFATNAPTIIKQGDIQNLLDKVANSEEKIVEIAYIHPNLEYVKWQQQLSQMKLKNKKGEDVQIKLRNIEPFDYSTTSEDTTFGEKLLSPIYNNISRDLSSAVDYETISMSENNTDPIEDMVTKYNNLYYHTQNIEDIIKRRQAEYRINFKPDYPVAIVEKHPKNNNVFLVNGIDIPGGYKSEIEAWESFKKTDKNGFGPYYEVPKEVLLNNTPKDVTVLFATTDNTPGATQQKLPNGHPARTVPIKSLRSLNYDDVKTNAVVIYDAQLDTAVYNAELSGDKKKTLADYDWSFVPQTPFLPSFDTPINFNTSLNIDFRNITNRTPASNGLGNIKFDKNQFRKSAFNPSANNNGTVSGNN